MVNPLGENLLILMETHYQKGGKEYIVVNKKNIIT